MKPSLISHLSSEIGFDTMERIFSSKPIEGQPRSPVIALACEVIRYSFVIWSLDKPYVSAHKGLPKAYVEHIESLTAIPEYIENVIQKKKECTVKSLKENSQFFAQTIAKTSNWDQARLFPIQFEGKMVGVIEVLLHTNESMTEEDIHVIRRLTEVAADTIESAQHIKRSQQLVEISRLLDGTRGSEDICRDVVKHAATLVVADWATLFLWRPEQKTFEVIYRWPEGIQVKREKPPSINGLTYKILFENSPVLIRDATLYPEIQDVAKETGIASSIGVPLSVNKELLGVLYVNSRKTYQFTRHDESLLKALAKQASVALGWSLRFFQSTEAIEQSIIDFSAREQLIAEQCEKVTKDFDFVALQLVHPEEKLTTAEQVIETVYATGIAQNWLGLRHYLNVANKDRDIQTDIALTDPPRAEIIAKWDSRFHRWVYDTFGQKTFIRIWVPLVIVWDSNGEAHTDWIETCTWERKKLNDHRTVFQLNLSNAFAHDHIAIIGTFEAGFEHAEKNQIPEEMALSLIRTISGSALNIYNMTLPGVLEVIAKQAVRVADADSASVHFPRNADLQYTYETGWRVDHSFLEQFRPRDEGLGSAAMATALPHFISCPRKSGEIKMAPTLQKERIQAMGAFPLIVGGQKGVLYVHKKECHTFTNIETYWIGYFASRAVDAIRHAILYTEMHEKSRKLKTINLVAATLADKLQEPELLKRIAWNILNLFSSDVVIVLEYDEGKGFFQSKPEVAGRIPMSDIIEKENISAAKKLVDERKNIYVEASANIKNPLYYPDINGYSFTDREGIESFSGLLLKADTEIVGVMFIYYRRKHTFSREEKETMVSLASYAAITIRNRRFWEQRTFLEKQQDALLILGHQLNSPLISSVTTLSALASNVPQEFSEDIQTVTAFIDDVISITHGMVKALSIEAEEQTFVKTILVDINSTVKQMVKRFQITNASNMLMQYDSTDDFPGILIDKDNFNLVLFGLMQNAYGYADPGSTIIFSCEVDSGKPILKVISTGKPIQYSEKDLIFEKYQRGQSNREKGDRHHGTGLGLWIGKTLMQSINGDLTLALDAENPFVSTFIIRFPWDDA